LATIANLRHKRERQREAVAVVNDRTLTRLRRG